MISFPPVTEMFQFSGFALSALYIQTEVAVSACAARSGFPIRKSPDQSVFGRSPKLIVAYNVLRRLCTPRHPPCALISLTTFMKRCGKPPSSLERTSFKHAPPPACLAAALHRNASKPALLVHGFDTFAIPYSLVRDQPPHPVRPMLTTERRSATERQI